MSLNLPKPPAWVEDAACKPDDDWAFFPAHGGPDHAQAAKAICRRCPVALACLTYALDFGPRLEGCVGWHDRGGATCGAGEAGIVSRPRRRYVCPPTQPHGTLNRYKNGGCRCEPCCRALSRYEKRRKYLAHIGLSATVPAHGFKRRVHALMAIGWTAKYIARELDIATGNLSNRMTYATTVRRGTHERMAEVYERLAMQVPPDTASSRRTRTIARKNSWAPPLAFDDIDDPNERPKGIGYSPRHYGGDLLAEVDHLTSLGVSLHQAARQLGVTVNAIEKARERARSAERQAS